VTLSISATFLATLGAEAFTRAAIGLILGGLLSAPLGAMLVKRIAPRWLLAMVGVVLLITSLYSIARALGW